MKRAQLVALALAADACAGDPEGWPHPVRFMGAGISRGEKLLRKPSQSPAVELASGTALSLALLVTTFMVTKETIKIADKISPRLGDAVELYFAWTCLAARNLHDEARAVLAPLEAGDLQQARMRLARIVGRDTAYLDAAEISRALIETIAESASDGVIAPLFYLTLGGAPLAMAYKAVNTLDSMIGHADRRYFYFGKFAARLDDVANYIPARLTALAIVGSASVDGSSATAWSTWRRDGHRHKSPNAGQPEAAMSGAVRARLGGANIYAGERIEGRQIGREFAAPQAVQARRSMAVMLSATALAAAAAMVLACCVPAALGRGRDS